MGEVNYTIAENMDNITVFENDSITVASVVASNATDAFYLSPGCKLYELITHTIIVGTLCLLGVVGNLFSFAVFQVDNLKTSTTFLFQGLSLTDTALLIVCFPVYCITPIVVYVGGEHPMYEVVNAYMLVYIYPIAMLLQTATIYVTVLVGINRYIAVCMPYQAARLCSVTKAKNYLAAVLVFSVVYNIPRFISGHVCIRNNKTEACLTQVGDNLRFNVIYNNILYLLIMLALPLFILTVLNIKLIKTLKTIKRRRSEMQTRQQQQDNNVTFVLIIVVLVFTVCQLPALVNQIFWNTLQNESRTCGGFQFYYAKLSNIMVILNSSVNFIIYILFNKRFKSVMLKNFCCCERFREEKSIKKRHDGSNGATQTLLTHV